MKIVSYIEQLTELEILLQLGMNEAVITSRELSRFSELSLDQTIALIKACQAKGVSCLLEWDILMTEDSFELAKLHFNKIVSCSISTVRLQDPGSVQWVKENYPQIKIQLILETGHHNLRGLKAWEDFLGTQLDRLILSPEIPKQKLQQYQLELDTPLEVLGLGRILLFYTPRSLITPLYEQDENLSTKRVTDLNNIEVLGTSEESPHKGFPIIENKHGTFMFNTKDLCLLDHIDELKQMKIKYFRVDLRFNKATKLLEDIQHLISNFDLGKVSVLKKQWPVPVIRGFFNTNKTDVLFPKLKNNRLKIGDQNYLGEVLDSVKQKYVAILIRSEKAKMKIGEMILLITPEGKQKEVCVKSLKNTKGEDLQEAQHGDLVYINPVAGVSVRTGVYMLSSTLIG